MDESSTKIMYEISKLTNSAKQIQDDFVQTIALVMFKELVNSMPNKEKYIDIVLDSWEEKIVEQKKDELEFLITKHTNLFELTAGAIVANSEDLDSFVKAVRDIKNVYRTSLLDT